MTLNTTAPTTPNTSYTTSRLQMPRALSFSLTASMYIGSGPLPGVGDEAKLLEQTWRTVVAPPESMGLHELLQLGAEIAPGRPIPVALEGAVELDFVLEPDEMDF